MKNYLAFTPILLATFLVGCGHTPMQLNTVAKQWGDAETMVGYVANIREVTDKSTQMEELCEDLRTTPFEKAKNYSRESYDFNLSMCRDLYKYKFVWMHLYGQYGNFVGSWVLVPKSDIVDVDDIAKISVKEYYSRRMATWIGVVVKAEDKVAKGCDWVGSKILNLGGVVCPSEGWDYRNLPAFKNS
jgi:hypothetical protein